MKTIGKQLLSIIAVFSILLLAVQMTSSNNDITLTKNIDVLSFRLEKKDAETNLRITKLRSGCTTLNKINKKLIERIEKNEKMTNLIVKKLAKALENCELLREHSEYKLKEKE